MRRKDREIIDVEEIEDIIKQALICDVAMCRDSQPYLVTMNFGFDEKYIYLHSAAEGLKIDILKENPLVCISFVQDAQFVPSLIPCESTMKYKSVVAFGRAEFITERDEKQKALAYIIKHYYRQVDEKRLTFSEYDQEKYMVLKVKIERISGKKC